MNNNPNRPPYRPQTNRMPPQYNGRPPQTVRKKKPRVPILIPVIVILILSVAVGLIFDAVSRSVERRLYPIAYSEYVEAASEMYGVPREVIYAVIRTESSFDPDALSHKGARGLMQLMPETYEWLTTKTDGEYDPEKIADPETNITYGTLLLSILYDRFLVWDTVYAAYNAGIGRVDGWLDDPKYSENGHLTDIPIAETAGYVVKVSDAVEVYRRLYEF